MPRRRPPIRLLRDASLRDLVSGPAELRASVLIPFEPAFPGSQRNGVVQRHAAETLAKRLAHWGLADDEVDDWCERLSAVRVDAHERDRSTRGLAIFLDAQATWVRPLAVPVDSLVVVAHDFRLREVLRSILRERPFRVLALSVNHVRLYAGGPSGLALVEAPGLPASLVDALGEEDLERQIDVRGAGAGVVRQASGPGRDDHAAELDRFHRVVAERLADELGDDDAPLVLAADAHHQAAFRRAAALACLLEGGVVGSPDHWSEAELFARVRELLDAAIEAEESGAGPAWERARRRGKGALRLADVAAAAAHGRVRRLWIAAEHGEPGRVDPERGDLVTPSGDDDVLDSLAALVLGHGGDVRVARGEDLPEGARAVAELR